MPTIKIADVPVACMHPEHNPPTMQVFSPGVYCHTCPSCGLSVTFTVQSPTMSYGYTTPSSGYIAPRCGYFSHSNT